MRFSPKHPFRTARAITRTYDRAAHRSAIPASFFDAPKTVSRRHFQTGDERLITEAQARYELSNSWAAARGHDGPSAFAALLDAGFVFASRQASYRRAAA